MTRATLLTLALGACGAPPRPPAPPPPSTAAADPSPATAAWTLEQLLLPDDPERLGFEDLAEVPALELAVAKPPRLSRDDESGRVELELQLRDAEAAGAIEAMLIDKLGPGERIGVGHDRSRQWRGRRLVDLGINAARRAQDPSRVRIVVGPWAVDGPVSRWPAALPHATMLLGEPTDDTTICRDGTQVAVRRAWFEGDRLAVEIDPSCTPVPPVVCQTAPLAFELRAESCGPDPVGPLVVDLRGLLDEQVRRLRRAVPTTVTIGGAAATWRP